MNYFELYKEVWQLHKKYSGIQQSNDMAWGNLIEEADTIVKRYESSRFARDLVTSVLNELERKSK
ncbi:MAG: hypothetical protein K2N34_14950 [Lachnospiraceae bacterium]|nr:hypothetical protein [Lachnospiraceae bacterium]